MLRLHFAPMTRAIRVRWLLEELELPHELVRVEFRPTSDRFFQQDTPTGKLPTLEDGPVVLCESGAIVEYLLERHGGGRLAPAPGDPERGEFLQWLHFAEATAFPPLGIVAWLSRYKGEAERYAELIGDARERAAAGLAFVEPVVAEREHLLASGFSAADVMLGFTLGAAALLGVLDARFPQLQGYWQRLQQRPALRRALDADPA